MTTSPVVGVLALQGAFASHQQRVRSLGADARLVKQPGDLDGVEALILPGGESTTMSMLLDTSALREPIAELLADGMPVFGTCAGMILCAMSVLDGRADQRGFGLIDLTVRRNGYGRQLDSFETDLEVEGIADPHRPFRAVFIRAPFVEAVADDVEVLATHDGHPVLVRHGSCTVAAFHPELTDDNRLHEMFVTRLSSPLEN